jgi:TolA-binding protein
MLDDDIQRVRETEVPWNELRQAGVFRRLEKARNAAPIPPPRRAPLLLLASALAIFAGIMLWRARPASVAVQAPSVVTGDRAAGESILRLADGSLARQSDHAHVELQATDEGRTDLLQTEGTVTYEVVHNPMRRFVVRVRDVSVSVLGTVFRVEVRPTEVAVHVERGQVEVAQLERRVRLNAGEGIVLETSPAVAAGGSSAEPADSAASGPPAIDSPPAPRAGDGAPKVMSPVQLLDRADRARARGELDDAAAALHELLRRYPNEARAALAEFMLGSVEMTRGAPAEAVHAFRACVQRAPGGTLGEDALAELAKAQALSGDNAGASSTAHLYLAAYPRGVHRRAMQRLVDGEP